MTSAPTLRLHLFGHPNWEYDGGPYRLSAGRRASAILYYLALKANAPIARESIAFALWPDEDEEDARTALRRELHRAIKALPPAPSGAPWILADELALQWNPAASCWIDVHAFEAIVNSHESLASAIALYSGDLLENIQDDWVFNDRERLRSAYFFALSEELSRHRSARAYSAAISCAQRILAADPFREDIVRALLALRYESGDRAGALREVDRYARLYKEELGVGLMPETEALRETIVASHALRAEPASVEPIPERISVATPFVGRTQELEQCHALWSRAARGAGSVLFVGGEAGIGKSRLLNELAILSEREGGRIVRGYTSPPESVPYEVFSTALQNAGALLDGVAADDSTIAAISRIAPQLVLHSKRPLVALAELDPAREQHRLFTALTHYISTLARTRPLLLILEDVHWAGISTLSALRALAQHVRSYPLLVAVTYRTEEAFEPLSALRRDLVGAGVAHHIALRRLSASDVHTIVRGTESFAHAVNTLVEEITTMADGHPFFLVEILAEHGLSRGAIGEIGNGTYGIINARLSRLQPTALKTIEIAANTGERFALDVLSSVSGLDEGVLLQAVAQLTDAHILQETSGRSAFDYSFTHNLIRDAIYAQIPPEQRRRRHYRIAHALAGGRFGEDRAFAGEIARHFDQANAHTEAAEWYRRAASYASAAYANTEALANLERALQLDSDERNRFELLKIHETLLHRLGRTAGRQEDLEVMERLARDLGEPYLFDVLTRRVELSLSNRDLDEASTLISEMERHASPDDRQCTALVAFARARILYAEGHPAEGLDVAQLALLGFHEARDAHNELRVHCFIVDLCIKLGDLQRAHEHIDLANRCGLGNTEQLAHTLLAASRESFAKGRYDEAEALARQSYDAFTSMGDRQGTADSAFSIANALGRLDRVREAMACCEEAADIYSSIGSRSRVAAVAATLGTLHSFRGNLPEGRNYLAAAEKVFRETEDVRGQTITTGNLGWIELMLGHNEKARTYSAKAAATARRMQVPTLEGEFLANLGAAERELGDIDSSIKHLEHGIELRGRSIMHSELFNDLTELALSHAQRGEYARAADLAREAVAEARTHEHTVWLHYVFWTAARAFALCGLEVEADEARKLAQEYMNRRRAELEDDPAALKAFDNLTLHRSIGRKHEVSRTAAHS